MTAIALIALAALTLANVADAVTTLALLKRGGVERNPLLGRKPSATRLWTFKIVSTVIVAAVLVTAEHASTSYLVMGLAAGIGLVALNNHRLMR